MREKMKLPPDMNLPDDLTPFGRLKEVTKRLLAVPREEIDRRLNTNHGVSHHRAGRHGSQDGNQDG